MKTRMVQQVVLLLVMLGSAAASSEGLSMYHLDWLSTPFSSCSGGSDCPLGRLKHPILVHASSTTTFPADLTSEVLFPDIHDAPLAMLMNRTNATLLEWSACGGSLLDVSDRVSSRKNVDVVSAEDLLSSLKSQQMCSVGSLGVCSTSETDAEAGFQLARIGGWVGAVLGSPFTSVAGTRSPPIHMRPSGLFLTSSERHSPRGGEWCSLHFSEHDTLCSHHLSAFLNEPRDNATASLLKSLPSFPFFLSTSFHRFSIRAERLGVPLRGRDGRKGHAVRVNKALTFLVTWRDELDQLKQHEIYRPFLEARKLLRSPSPAVRAPTPVVLVVQRFSQDDSARGVLKWELLIDHHRNADPETHIHAPWSVVVDVLAVVPLKIATPLLHSARLESVSGGRCNGTVRSLRPHFDKRSESVMAVLRVSASCCHGPSATSLLPNSGPELAMTVFVDMVLSFVHQEQLPPNANKAFFLPNPLVRYLAASEASAGEASRSTISDDVDEDYSTDTLLARQVFHLLLAEEGGSNYRRWLYGRARGICVVTLAIGDAAMVFNAVALGMLGPAMLIGGLFRVMLRRDKPEKDKVD